MNTAVASFFIGIFIGILVNILTAWAQPRLEKHWRFLLSLLLALTAVGAYLAFYEDVYPVTNLERHVGEWDGYARPSILYPPSWQRLSPRNETLILKDPSNPDIAITVNSMGYVGGEYTSARHFIDSYIERATTQALFELKEPVTYLTLYAADFDNGTTVSEKYPIQAGRLLYSRKTTTGEFEVTEIVTFLNGHAYQAYCDIPPVLVHRYEELCSTVISSLEVYISNN